MADLQFLYGTGAKDDKVVRAGTIYLDIEAHELWYDKPGETATSKNHVQLFKDTYINKAGDNQISGNLIPKTDNAINLGSSTYRWANIYAAKVNGYTLADASAKGVKDSTKATALTSSGTSLVTERAVFYGLAKINNASQKSDIGIYAPTSAGTSGYILKSSGGTTAPVWATVDSLMGAYVKKAGDTMTGVLTISNNTASTSMTTGALLVTGGIATQDQLSAKTIEINDKATVQYDTTRQALRFVVT